MEIIRRISRVLFGFVSGVVGLVSVLVSVALMVICLPSIGDRRERIFMAIWVLLVCQVLLAFGIAASLLGLKCILGPKEWTSRAIDTFWNKAMKIAFLIPVLVFGSVLIFRLIDRLAE